MVNYAEIISCDQAVSNTILANNSTTEPDDASATLELITCVKPIFTATPTIATCNGGVSNNNASIAITGLVNGTYRIGYSIGATYSGAAYAAATSFTGTSYTLTNLPNPSAATTYVIRIYSGGQCCLQEATVTLNPSPCASAINNGPLCLGATATLSAEGGTTYNWAGPNSFTSTAQNPTLTAVAAAAGTYTVTVTSGPNTSTATTVLVINLPAATAAVNTPIAATQTIFLQSGGGATYSWAGPLSYTSTAQNPSIASATVAMSGTYTVTVTNGSGCTATSTVVVTVASGGTGCTVAATATANPCDGTNVTLTATATGVTGAGYLWAGPNGYSSTAQNPVITGVTGAHDSGTYTVTVTSSNGCFSTSSVVVNVTSPPATPFASANATLDAGQTLNLTAISADTPTSWSWSGPNGFSAATQNAAISNITIAASGTYTVAAYNGTCSSTATIEVTVLPSVSLILTKTANQTSVTSGQTVTFTLQVQNTSSVAATNVVVNETIPAGLNYVSSVPGSGSSYNPFTGLWSIPSIAANGTVTMTIQVTVQ